MRFALDPNHLSLSTRFTATLWRKWEMKNCRVFCGPLVYLARSPESTHYMEHRVSGVQARQKGMRRRRCSKVHGRRLFEYFTWWWWWSAAIPRWCASGTRACTSETICFKHHLSPSVLRAVKSTHRAAGRPACRVSERRPIFWCKLPDKCARLNYCTASICGSARGRWQICQISHHYLIFYILNYDVYAWIAILLAVEGGERERECDADVLMQKSFSCTGECTLSQEKSLASRRECKIIWFNFF